VAARVQLNDGRAAAYAFVRTLSLQLADPANASHVLAPAGICDFSPAPVRWTEGDGSFSATMKSGCMHLLHSRGRKPPSNPLAYDQHVAPGPDCRRNDLSPADATRQGKHYRVPGVRTGCRGSDTWSQRLLWLRTQACVSLCHCGDGTPLSLILTAQLTVRTALTAAFDPCRFAAKSCGEVCPIMSLSSVQRHPLARSAPPGRSTAAADRSAASPSLSSPIGSRGCAAPPAQPLRSQS